MGSHAHHRVDVAVGVVAYQHAVVKPHDAVGSEPLLQPLFYLLLRQGLVAVGSQQTRGGGEHRATAVALNASAFKHEVEVRLIKPLHLTFHKDLPVDVVVEVGGKFLAPSVELEVEQDVFAVVLHGDEAVVACPGVVVGNVVNHQHRFPAFYLALYLCVDGGDFW